MTIKEVEGDILTLQNGILVHGCNTLGQMGSGIAKQIRQKWPECYEFYAYECEQHPKLGRVIYWATPTWDSSNFDGVLIANALTQARVSYTGELVVDYEAIAQAFRSVYDMSTTYGLSVHFPLIGCGLGGGDWNIVSQIIEKECPVDLTLWRYKP